MNLPLKLYAHRQGFGEDIVYIEFSAGSLVGHPVCRDGATYLGTTYTREIAAHFVRQGAWREIATCRDDGRCQYAIDVGAEGVAACPVGKCQMPGARHWIGQVAHKAAEEMQRACFNIAKEYEARICAINFKAIVDAAIQAAPAAADNRLATLDEALRELRQYGENLMPDSTKRPGIARAINILEYLKGTT